MRAAHRRHVRRTLELAAGLLLALTLRAGTIEGSVAAAGPETGGTQGGGGSYQSRRYKFADKIDYDHLRDFVISIDEPVPAPQDGAPPPEKKPRVVQRDVDFEPHVLPIVVGTIVRWPNDDEIFHNVFSMSEAKQFDLGTYLKEKVPEVRFDKVGQVDVFCSIHSKMHCIILVLPNPYFAMADSSHRYVIADVPPGTYRLRAWHERLPSQMRTVTVSADATVHVDFVLSLSELPKY